MSTKSLSVGTRINELANMTVQQICATGNRIIVVEPDRVTYFDMNFSKLGEVFWDHRGCRNLVCTPDGRTIYMTSAGEVHEYRLGRSWVDSCRDKFPHGFSEQTPISLHNEGIAYGNVFRPFDFDKEPIFTVEIRAFEGDGKPFYFIVGDRIMTFIPFAGSHTVQSMPYPVGSECTFGSNIFSESHIVGSGGNSIFLRFASNVQVYDAATLTYVSTLKLPTTKDSRIAVSPSGKKVAAACGKKVFIVEVKDGYCDDVSSWHASQGALLHVAFAGENVLLTAGMDRSIRSWAV